MKKFYSIKEVAQIFDLNVSTLRFWEKEFEMIHPQKTNLKRVYSTEDIEQISLVHYLLKVRKMTIAGTRQKLKDNKEETVNQEDIYRRLDKVRNELYTIINMLDDYEKGGN